MEARKELEAIRSEVGPDVEKATKKKTTTPKKK